MVYCTRQRLAGKSQEGGLSSQDIIADMEKKGMF